MKSRILSLAIALVVAFCMMPAISGQASAAVTVNTPTLTSVTKGTGKVIVRWQSVSGATGYQVYRSTNGASYEKMFKTRNLRYTNTLVSEGNRYAYKVRAYKKLNGKFYFGKLSKGKSVYYGVEPNSKWKEIQNKYRNDSGVNYLIFVKNTSGSKAIVNVYEKRDGLWYKEIDCKGWVGANGIDKVQEGDKKTPTGTFNITQAFGIKSKPKTKLDYLLVNKYHYWCGDKTYYNKLVDTSKVKHSCPNGEHLIDYKGAYDYGLFMDFNKECVYKKGSAIFMHCTTNYAYTSGCISVDKQDMLDILALIDKKTKICIYKAYQ